MEPKNSRGKYEMLVRAGALLLAIGIFAVVLSLNLTPIISRLFTRFQVIHFAGLCLLYYVLFRWGGKWGSAAGLIVAALIFALPFGQRLASGLSNATVIGGFIPYKDGFYYYNGANKLLSGQLIPQGGLQGAFRPLLPGLIAVLQTLTNQNLLVSQALLIFGLALCVYAAALAMRSEFGALPAASFIALNFAFIRPMIGDSLGEIPSLALACLSLILLLNAAKNRSVVDAVLGGVLLILALSIRAGAFFILPCVVVWLAWRFGGERKLLLRWLLIFAGALMAAFVIINMLYPRQVSAGGGSAFGNFSWMLYGQAVGGAGWDYHVRALGTSDSAVVLQAALDKIRTYPLGLLIGIAKAYRDFFTRNTLGIFDLLAGEKTLGDQVFWLTCTTLLLVGAFRCIKERQLPNRALLLAALIGTLLSIPFLPPIDGGNRFYSGSFPFLAALMAAGIMNFPGGRFEADDGAVNSRPAHILRWVSGGLALVMLAGPPAVLQLNRPVQTLPVACGLNEMVVNAQYTHGSFVDILPEGSPDCGRSPRLCLSVFEKGGMEKSVDDFFVKLTELAVSEPGGLRLWAGIEYASQGYYFLAMPIDMTEGTQAGLRFSGCAEKIETRFQRILLLRKIQPLN